MVAPTLGRATTLGTPELDSRRRKFVAAYSFSIFGTGFVYPLTALFMSRVIGASAAQVATYFVAVAVGSMVVSPFAGAVADRTNPRRVGIAGITLQAAGSLVLAASTTIPQAAMGGALLGVGNGLFFGTQTSIFVAIFGRELIGRIYALQYLVMNVAVAVAGIAGTGLVSLLGEPGYRVAFALNGISFAGYGCVLFLVLLRKSPRPTEPEPAEPGASIGLLARVAEPFRSPTFIRLIVLQLLISAAGFAQMDAVMPLVLGDRGNLDVIVVGVFLALNGVAVVVMQPRFTRLVPRIGEGRALSLVLLTWLTAYGIAFVGIELVSNTALRVGLVLLFAVVFALGEVLLSPSFQPLVVDAAPEDKLGAFSSMISTVYSLGLLLGPVATLPLLGSSHVWSFWAVIAAALLVGWAVALPRHERSVRPTSTGVPS